MAGLDVETYQHAWQWIQKFLNGEINAETLHAETGLSPEELAYCLPDYVDNVNYNAVRQGGDQVAHVPHPPPPPPHGSDESVYKQYLTQVQNNYYHDESIRQVINNYGDGDVNAQIATHGGVNVGGSVDDGLINTGHIDDSNVAVGTHGPVNQVGDVTTTADHGGQAQSGINFGDGDLKQNQQNQHVDVNKTGDNTTGHGGAGGAGTGGDANAGGGAGGAGGHIGHIEDVGNIGHDVHADGGDGGHGGAAAGGAGVGGAGGHSGDAGDHIDVDVHQDAPVF